MSDETTQDGWFMCYAFSIPDAPRIQMGSTTWRAGETPWQKISRWAKEDPHRKYVLVSWKRLSSDEVFECDSETDF